MLYISHCQNQSIESILSFKDNIQPHGIVWNAMSQMLTVPYSPAWQLVGYIT